jgi:hypothetical protein
MPCRFQEAGICKDCPGGEGYEPKKGTVNLEDGVLCLDFNRLIPYDLAFVPRKLPGGRHVVDVIQSMEKLDNSRRKYQKSEKGKATQKKYQESERGQKSQEEYQNSPKFKLSRQKYLESQKGKQAIEKSKERKRDWRKAAKWLEDNPDKTLEDYFKEA